MDDEPIWAADRVVALTPGSAITILETANEFAIKGNHLTLVKGNQFDGRTKTDPHKHIHEFLRICDMFKCRDIKNEPVRLMMFPLSLTGEAKTWLDELNEGTIELMCDASDFAVGAILEFDIEIKDRKGAENVAADRLYRIKNDETSDDSEVDDDFPGETIMEINTKNKPWFADFANYLVVDIIPKGMTYQQKNKFFSDLKHYFWEEPYLFKVCSDGMIRRCISSPETGTILDQCHHGPTGGYYGPNITAKKVLASGFYRPTIMKEAHTLVQLCEACQKTGNIPNVMRCL
ncbi:hypothetical protein Tco_0210213 [Tanacetum coccineum]